MKRKTFTQTFNHIPRQRGTMQDRICRVFFRNKNMPLSATELAEQLKLISADIPDSYDTVTRRIRKMVQAGYMVRNRFLAWDTTTRKFVQAYRLAEEGEIGINKQDVTLLWDHNKPTLKQMCEHYRYDTTPRHILLTLGGNRSRAMSIAEIYKAVDEKPYSTIRRRVSEMVQDGVLRAAYRDDRSNDVYYAIAR